MSGDVPWSFGFEATDWDGSMKDGAGVPEHHGLCWDTNVARRMIFSGEAYGTRNGVTWLKITPTPSNALLKKAEITMMDLGISYGREVAQVRVENAQLRGERDMLRADLDMISAALRQAIGLIEKRKDKG